MGIGSTMKFMSKFGGTAKLATTALGIFGKAGAASAATTAIAGTATAGLGTALAGIALPVAGAVAAIGVAGFAYHKYKKKSEEAAKQEKKTQKQIELFGTTVSNSTEKSAKKFGEMREKASTELSLLDTVSEEKGKSISENLVKHLSGMGGEVVKSLTESKEQISSVIDGISLDLGEAGQGIKEKAKTDISGRYDEDIKKIEEAKQRISELYKEVDGNLQNLSVTQREEFYRLTSFVSEQATVFAKSYKELEGMSGYWANNKKTLTIKAYQSEFTRLEKQHKKVTKANKDNYKAAAEDLKTSLVQEKITQEEYDVLMSGLDAQRAKNKAKSDSEYYSANSSMLKKLENNGKTNFKTMQTLAEAERDVGYGRKMYFDDYNKKIYNTQEEWIAATKKHNAEYIKSLGTSNKEVKKQLDDYEKAQKEAYKATGSTAKEAAKQAKEDRQKLENDLKETAKILNKAADKHRSGYIEGLKGDDNQIAEVAKKWGLDLENTTDTIDFGKYGNKTAKEFFDEFRSGSDEGAEMAKIYFKQKLESVASNDLTQVGEQDIATLKTGLESGSLTLADLKEHFGKTIFELFPQDLSQLSADQIETLKNGFKAGVINTDDLKQRFGDQIKDIFKHDLSDVTKGNMDTIKLGLDLNIINPEDLKKRYGDELEKIFSKDMTNVGAGDIQTLTNGYNLGIPGCKETIDGLASYVGDNTKVDVTGHGQMTMGQLLAEYEAGKITSDQFFDAFSGAVHDKSNIDLTEEGKKPLTTFDNGAKETKEAPKRTVKEVVDDVNGKLSSPAKKAKSKGEKINPNFAAGMDSNANEPKKSAKKTKDSVFEQLNDLIEGVNILGTNFGGAKLLAFIKAKKFATGTKGKLASSQLAFVGDGGEHELIKYPNGRAALSPNRTTLTHLPAGSQVFSGKQTKEIFNISKQLNIPMFAKGTGSKLKDWFGDKLDSLLDFITKPVELWKKLTSKAFDLSVYKDPYAKIVGPGAKNHVDGMTGWIKKLMESATVVPAGSSGVSRWQPVIKKAAALMGQSLSAKELNGILAQIQRESGGNDKIIQSSAVWDVNTASGNPARGLLQYIPQTFNAYRVPGYGNILDGFHQLMAFFNNRNWRSDLPYGKSGWEPSGGRIKGYANGGIVSRHQIAQIAEGNKSEMIIPLTKNSRAVQLVNQAKQILGMEDGKVVVSNDNTEVVESIQETNERIDKLYDLVDKFAELVTSGAVAVNIDSQKAGVLMANAVDVSQGSRVRLSSRGVK